MEALKYLTPPHFPSHVTAAFFTRQSGVSKGLFSSLNVGYNKGDPPENVEENRRRICATFNLPPTNLITVSQQHGSEVVKVRGAITPTQADALITATPNLLLGIGTADCVAVLLADRDSPWVAAVHVGWKGAYAGILHRTIKLLREEGVSVHTLNAALGPCIWQDSYEVTQEFYERFSQAKSFFKPANQPGRWLFDLPGYIVELLQQEGVSQISSSPRNTFTDETNFFSYRRCILRQEGHYGNTLAAIMHNG